MRRYESFPVSGKNSLQIWPQTVSPWKVIWNFLVITASRYSPSLEAKNFMYRHLLGMRIGRDVSVGLMAMFDIFFPELIAIGDNSIIGYNCTLLGHEYLIDEYRKGPVEIGANVMVGANTTILPGVRIGDHAVVSACSLVNRDIPSFAFAGGVPVKILGYRSHRGQQNVRHIS